MTQWKSNPFADFGGAEHSTGFSFSPHASRSNKSKPLTTQQVLMLQLALHQHKNGSFWDEVKHAGGKGLHPVGWTLDKLMRPLYGTATALTEGQQATNEEWDKAQKEHASWWETEKRGFSKKVFSAMGHGFMEGVRGKKHDTMSDFLKVDPKTRKWANKHKTQAAIAGFGLDIAVDPLTYVTGGTSRVLTKSAEHAGLVKAGDVALHGKDDLESLKQAQTALSRGGKDYSARHALAQERIKHLTEGMDAGAADRLHIAQNVAQAEKKRVEKFLPQYKIGARGKGIPITPTYIGGTRVVPALPKLDNFIAKSPVGAKAAESFRNKFIRAADETPEAHAARITRQHIAEAHAQENLNVVRDVMRGVKISEEKALKALHYGETHKNFILKTKTGRFRINEGAIVKLVREGKLDESQVLFLRRWFKATELLHAKDKALGVAYHHTGEAGRLYVPHLVDKLGRPLADLQKNTLTRASFQHNRGKGGLSVLQLAEKAKAGELGRGVETNPFMLLAHTARARAQKQADMSLANTYAAGFGIKTRVVDTAKLAKKQSALESLAVDHALHIEGHGDAMASAHHSEQEWLVNHQKAFDEKLAELEKKHRSFKFRNNTKTKKANVARVQKQIIKLHEKHISDLEEIQKGKHAPLNDHIKDHLELASQHHEAMDAIKAQQKRLETEIKRLKIGKANRKEYSKAKHETVPGIVDEHGHPLAFDPEVAHAITKYQKIASGEDKAIQDFADGWRKYMAKWKLAVTSVNPGYRIRNSMSDVWAMYLSGVPMHAIPKYSAMGYRMARLARRPDTPEGKAAAKLITEAYHHGILSGLYQGDVQAVAGFIKYSGTKRSLVRRGHPLQAATKMMQDFNANVENLGRMTHYLYRREALHESPIEAAAKVKAAHFDYEDLTPFEQNKMKAVAPFYTWTRKNLPFQVKALFAAPGKFATLPKAMAESESAAGGDPGNIVPDYISRGLGFQIPFGKHNYYMPQIGAADLSVLDSPDGALQRAEGLINPAIRTPFELATNKNLFTGAPIKSDTHERNPVSNIGAGILSLIPGSDVGQTSRKVGGKDVTGPGANPYYAYLLGQIPMMRQIGLNYSGINKERNTTNLLSYFGGQSVQNVDPAEQKMIASIKLQDELKREVASLRDAGLLPRSKSKKSKHQKLIDQIAFGREGR